MNEVLTEFKQIREDLANAQESTVFFRNDTDLRERQRSRRRILILGGVLLALALSALGILALLRSRKHASEPDIEKEAERSDEIDPNTVVAWNAPLRAQLEPLFAGGIRKGVGRHLYSELDTALAQKLTGKWQVGAKLLADEKAREFRVLADKIEIAFLTDEQTRDLGPRVISRTVNGTFRLRQLPLLRLEDVRLSVRPAEGNQPARLDCQFQTTVLKNQRIYDPTFGIASFSAPGQPDDTNAEFLKDLRWKQTQDGWHQFTINYDPIPGRGEVPLRVRIVAFVTEPTPSFYQISNEMDLSVFGK